jgi:hypothetical protein
MSDDVTDRIPGDEISTRDLVLQLIQLAGDSGGRMGRVQVALGIGEPDTQPLSGRVNWRKSRKSRTSRTN